LLNSICFLDSEQLEKFIQRENEILNLIKSSQPKHIIKIIDTWTENADFAFIQMELSDDNLFNVLVQKCHSFGRTEGEPMNSLEFFISCKMFEEMTEGIVYLHYALKPSLIHRNMKPDNVLIRKDTDGLTLKITDFNLSLPRDFTIHPLNKKNRRFIAPEVKEKDKYSIEADVYSLGVIGWQIFFDIIYDAKKTVLR